jgi:hypothetical protein
VFVAGGELDCIQYSASSKHRCTGNMFPFSSPFQVSVSAERYGSLASSVSSRSSLVGFCKFLQGSHCVFVSFNCQAKIKEKLGPEEQLKWAQDYINQGFTGNWLIHN